MGGRVLRCVLLSFTLLLPAAAASAQAGSLPPPPGGAPAQEPTGTARLTITVVAADTGVPVSRVQVRLNGLIRPPGEGQGLRTSVTLTGSAVEGGTILTTPGGSRLPATGLVQKDGETDDQGRIEFRSLPAIRYSLAVSPRSPFLAPERSPFVQVKEGDAASLTVRLERGGAITGRILDEDGNPIAGVSPTALSTRPNDSRRLLPGGRSVGTDDRGQYRVFDLRPGDYYVLARPEPRSPVSSFSHDPHVGPVPTYYPGAATLDAARLVSVRPGQDTGGIDFSLVQAKLARISGRATDSAGNPVVRGPHGGVSLVPRGADEFGRGILGAHGATDGTFAFENVPPGNYALSAFLRHDEASMPPEGVWLPLTVNGEDVSIDIRTNKGATLSGHVTVDGVRPDQGRAANPLGPQVLASSPVIMVMPSSATISQGFTPGRSEPVGDDGMFRVTGVRGSLILKAGKAGAALKSIRRGSEDLMGKVMDLDGTENIDDIEIVLTTDTGTIAGTVTDSGGKPAPGIWLLVFSENRKLWFPTSPFVRPSGSWSAEAVAAAERQTARPSSVGVARRPYQPEVTPRAPGQFAVPYLLPGRYYVVVLGREEENGLDLLQFDAERLAGLREKATAATVAPGETTTVSLRVEK